jgi:acyl carrier protein
MVAEMGGTPLDANLYEKILSFVSWETGTRKKNLSTTTDLARDLGVDGDDAFDLIDKFGKEFVVDLSDFKFDSYFGSEGGGNLIRLIRTISRGRERAPLTGALSGAVTAAAGPIISRAGYVAGLVANSVLTGARALVPPARQEG